MSKLRATLLTILLLLPYQYAMANPAWIEQASRPGPDVAPVGQSRFDQLFLQPDGRYKIPYPFERLIEALENRLDNGDNPAVRQVLVPIGRSLQRESPAPDYFHFPRNIITLEGEPITVDRQAGQVMEYRLFIAHQPSTETLEIISYNDAAGRFEFQLAQDYAAGKPCRFAAQVRFANRGGLARRGRHRRARGTRQLPVGGTGYLAPGLRFGGLSSGDAARHAAIPAKREIEFRHRRGRLPAGLS
jgi:hypothetical protein